MKDWQGNQIKIGDTISAYYYKHFFGGSKLVAFIEDKDGFSEVPMGISPEFRWALAQRFKVVPPSNEIILSTNEGLGEVGINMVDSCLVLPQKHLMCLCIEGVSDSQELFFEDYFKVQK
jgi:hypothetical protein